MSCLGTSSLGPSLSSANLSKNRTKLVKSFYENTNEWGLSLLFLVKSSSSVRFFVWRRCNETLWDWKYSNNTRPIVCSVAGFFFFFFFTTSGCQRDHHLFSVWCVDEWRYSARTLVYPWSVSRFVWVLFLLSFSFPSTWLGLSLTCVWASVHRWSSCKLFSGGREVYGLSLGSIIVGTSHSLAVHLRAECSSCSLFVVSLPYVQLVLSCRRVLWHCVEEQRVLCHYPVMLLESSFEFVVDSGLTLLFVSYSFSFGSVFDAIFHQRAAASPTWDAGWGT